MSGQCSWGFSRVLLRPRPRAAVARCARFDGARWLTLDGPALGTDDPDAVAAAVAGYAAR